jgi:hypothetical protein
MWMLAGYGLAKFIMAVVALLLDEPISYGLFP